MTQEQIQQVAIAHQSKLENATNMTILLGGLGAVFFLVSFLTSQPEANIREAYTVGEIFSLLIFTYGVLNKFNK